MFHVYNKNVDIVQLFPTDLISNAGGFHKGHILSKSFQRYN